MSAAQDQNLHRFSVDGISGKVAAAAVNASARDGAVSMVREVHRDVPRLWKRRP
eukprot:COSAG02_NODE_46502_length_348_cov_0.835341_1_plen_53_part_10